MVELKASHAVASAACFAKSVTPHADNANGKAAANARTRNLMRASLGIEAAISL
jgi:hypothetical protein